jgi:ATP-binding cassette subfamily F protein 3
MFIKIENLAKKYNEEYVFSNVNLMLTDAHKIGIIGKNGSGKTTFLEILARRLTPEKGKIEIDPNGAKVIYHSQVLENDITGGDDGTLMNCFSYLLSQNPTLFELHKQIANPTDLANFPELISEYTEKGGYALESRIVEICKRLKLDPDQSINSLSGGQKTRLQLGKVMLDKADILLLDEPTNHLDIDGIEFFYEFIEKFHGIVIIATHDRNLLTRSITKIIEFEDHVVREYTGNYEFYKKQKLEKRLAAENKMRANERKVEKLNMSAKGLEDRITRHEKRATEATEINLRISRMEKKNKSSKTKIIQKKLSIYKDNDKLIRNFKLDRQATKLSANRSNILSKAGRIKTVRKKVGWGMKMDFDVETAQSNYLLRISKLSKNYGEKEVLKDFSFELKTGEKVAITGPNGTGKTTILKCIADEITDYKGGVMIADQVKIGYLDQENASLDFENTVLHEFELVANGMPEGEARAFLHFFLFEGNMAQRKVGNLSEGEKLKLKLAKLLYSKANLLLLDEPTNHLDIASQEVIEKALHDFEGSIVLVTHDEALMKGIGVNRIINLQ